MNQVIIKDNNLYHTTAIGLWIPSGSVNDPAGKEGLHHLLEHIYFKDPLVMKAQNILDQEGVLYNAFTSQEITCFLGQAKVEDTGYLLDFLMKIKNSLVSLTEEELEKEKRVIIEELHYYNSQPLELLKSLALKSILGMDNNYTNNICGSIQSVRGITRVDVINGLETFHQNKILIISGSMNEDFMAFFNQETDCGIALSKDRKKSIGVNNTGTLLWSKYRGRRDQAYYSAGLFIPDVYGDLSQSLLNGLYKHMNSLIREELSLTYRILPSSMQLNQGNLIILLFQTSVDNLNQLRKSVELVWQQYISQANLEQSLREELAVLNKLNFIKADNPLGELKKIAMSQLFPKEYCETEKPSIKLWLQGQHLSEAILVNEDVGLGGENYCELH